MWIITTSECYSVWGNAEPKAKHMSEIGHRHPWVDHYVKYPEEHEPREWDWKVAKPKYKYYQNKRVLHHPLKQMMLGEAMLKWEKDKVLEHVDEMQYIVEYIMTAPEQEVRTIICQERDANRREEPGGTS